METTLERCNSPRRRLKDKLAARELVIGVYSDFPSSSLIEFLGGLGFDYVFIDCEHAGPDFERVVDMARAARAAGYAALLRPWSNEPGLLRRFIDCGIDGLICPDVESAAQAQDIVRAIKAAEPPDLANFVLAALIESKAGVAQAEHICRVPGVDLVIVGASDLAVSQGYSRHSKVDDVRRQVLEVIAVAKAAQVSASIPAALYGIADAWEHGANVMLFRTRELLRVGLATFAPALDTARKSKA